MITNSFNANLDITHFIQSQRFCCHKLSNQTCVEQIISNMCFNSWSNWITSTFFTKHQDNIVHRYSIRNQAYDAFYPNLIIKVTFRWKMDVFNTLALKVQEPQGLKPRRKVGPLGHPFWFTVISKSYFRSFQAWIPVECMRSSLFWRILQNKPIS